MTRGGFLHLKRFEGCHYKPSQYLALAMLPILVAGVILTSISVYVYTRPSQRKNTVGFLLACLSISELIFLFVSIPSFSLIHVPFIACSANTNRFLKFKAFTIVYIYPLTLAAKCMSVCLSIIVSVQQWVAVFRPMKVKTWCSMGRTKVLVFLSLVFSVVLAIPKFLDITIDENGRPTRIDSVKDNMFFKSVAYFDKHIFNASLVFLILLVINISIMMLLRWSRHERMRLMTITTQSTKDRKTFLMLSAVMLSYVIAHFPSMILEYGDNFLKAVLSDGMILIRKELSNFFICCHPILSFVVYIMFSVNYRNIVRSQLTSQDSSSAAKLIDSTRKTASIR